MKVLGLISGGKDSCYCMMQCVGAGHQIVALGHLHPVKGIEELDSYMYQSVGHQTVQLYAEAMGLPLFQREIKGSAKIQSMNYFPNTDDEVEDLFKLLESAKREVDFDAVASGAILSDYQRIRVENVCSRLGIVSLAYLWRRSQEELLVEMIDCGVSAVIIKVAALGLNPDKHLGKDIKDVYDHLMKMKNSYDLNVCGEGGEYETFTLDCPLFCKSIAIDDKQVVLHSADAFAPVAYIVIKAAHLEDKPGVAAVLGERLNSIAIPQPLDYVQDVLGEDKDVPEMEVVSAGGNLVNIFEDKVDRPSVSSDNCGQTWISGVVGRGESMRQATHSAMNSIKEILKSGLGWQHLISVSVFIRDMSHYTEFNNAYKTCFEVNPPVRACVAIHLPADVWFIIDCVAFDKTVDSLKVVMHVQSISHWAPANIGPYSQAIQVGNTIYTAGQIALVPGSMQLIPAGPVGQNILALRHVERVLEAINSECSLFCVVCAVCYVTHPTIAEILRDKLSSVLDEKPLPLLQVAVVSALPRGASVEWQVMAHLQSERFTTKISISFPFKDLQAQLKFSECIKDEEEGMLLVQLMCAAVGDVQPQHIEIAVDSAKQRLRSLLPESHANFIQILFDEQVEGILEARRLLMGLQPKPSLSIIPVSKLENSNCVFSILLVAS